MDLVVLEARQQRAAAEREDDLIELGRTEVVAVVGNEDDLLERTPHLQPEGSRAVGVPCPAIWIPFDLLAVDDVRHRVGELLEEVGHRLGELDAERVLVDHLDAADLIHAAVELVAYANDVAEVVEHGGGEVGGVGGTLEAELEVFRGDTAAIVEDHVVAQEERVDEAAVGDLPALGDVGHDVEVEVEGDETAKYLGGVDGGAGIAYLDGVENGGGVVPEGDQPVLAADAADGAVVVVVVVAVIALAGGVPVRVRAVAAVIALGGCPRSSSRRGLVVIAAIATGQHEHEHNGDRHDQEGDGAHHQSERAIGHAVLSR